MIDTDSLLPRYQRNLRITYNCPAVTSRPDFPHAPARLWVKVLPHLEANTCAWCEALIYRDPQGRAPHFNGFSYRLIICEEEEPWNDQ